MGRVGQPETGRLPVGWRPEGAAEGGGMGGFVGWVEVRGRGRGWRFKSGKELLRFARETKVRSIP